MIDSSSSPLLDLKGRVRRKFRRLIISAIGLDYGQNYFLDSFMGAARTDVERVGLVSAARQYNVPYNRGGWAEMGMSWPDRYIYALPDAILEPTQNFVYDRNGRFIAESAAEGLYRLCLQGVDLEIRAPTRRVAGEWLHFGLSNNLYHGLLQDLPPFLAAAKAFPKLPILARATNFKPALAILKTFADRHIEWVNTPIRVERLIMGAKTAGQGRPHTHSSVHPTDIELLRNWAKTHVCDGEDLPLSDVIYVSRSRARRGMKNEMELETALASDGVHVFHGNMPFFDQIRTFRRARLVAGPSGAGLVNLVWMRPGGKVRMIASGGFYAPFYVELSSYMEHNFAWWNVTEDTWSDREIKLFREHISEALV